MWGEGGKDGKYVRVGKDSNRPLKQPKERKLRNLENGDNKIVSNDGQTVARPGNILHAMEPVGL
jgi:hypothetical protein